MKWSFFPKYEPNIVRISSLYCATLKGKKPNKCTKYGIPILKVLLAIIPTTTLTIEILFVNIYYN